MFDRRRHRLVVGRDDVPRPVRHEHGAVGAAVRRRRVRVLGVARRDVVGAQQPVLLEAVLAEVARPRGGALATALGVGVVAGRRGEFAHRPEPGDGGRRALGRAAPDLLPRVLVSLREPALVPRQQEVGRAAAHRVVGLQQRVVAGLLVEEPVGVDRSADLIELERLPVVAPVGVVVLPPRAVAVDPPLVGRVRVDLGVVEPVEGATGLRQRADRRERLYHDDEVPRPDVPVGELLRLERAGDDAAVAVLRALDAGHGELVQVPRRGGGRRRQREVRVPRLPERLEGGALALVPGVERPPGVVDRLRFARAEPDARRPADVGVPSRVESDGGVHLPLLLGRLRERPRPVDVEVLPRAAVGAGPDALEADPLPIEGGLPGLRVPLREREVPVPVVRDDEVVAVRVPASRSVDVVAGPYVVHTEAGQRENRVSSLVPEAGAVVDQKRRRRGADEHPLVEGRRLAVGELELVVDLDLGHAARAVAGGARDGVVADVEGDPGVRAAQEHVEVVELFDVQAERGDLLDQRPVPRPVVRPGVLVDRREHVSTPAEGGAHDRVLVARSRGEPSLGAGHCPRSRRPPSRRLPRALAAVDVESVRKRAVRDTVITCSSEVHLNHDHR